jgi:hypothetical protein
MPDDNVLVIEGLDELQLTFEETMGAIQDPVLWAQIGSYLKSQILLRTSTGESPDGTSFEPYSIPYAKIRAEKELPVDTPDLFFSGAMLGALQFDAKPGLVRLFFLDTPDSKGVSNAAKAYYNQQLRNFFGWSAEDVEIIEEMVQRAIREGLRG